MEQSLAKLLDSDSKTFHNLLLLLAVIMQILLAVLFAYEGLIPVIAVVLLPVVIVAIAFSLQYSFYLFAAYFLIFPDKFYSAFFPGVPVDFLWIVGYLLFLVLCFFWIIYLLQHSTKFSFKILDRMWLLFMTSVLISAVLGILRGHDFVFFRLEIMPLSLYLTYFIFLHSPLKDNPKRFYDIILLCSVIIALEFVDSLFRFGGRIFLVRVVSMHIHVTLFATAYICTTLIFSTNRRRKILIGAALPLILVSVAISQQRGMWGATLIVLILAFLVYIYHRRDKISTILATIGGIALVLFLSYIFVNLLTRGTFHNTVVTRGSILLNLEQILADESYVIRANETVEALRTVKGDFLFGKGIGASVMTRWRFMEHATVDNSYAYLYWKMGIFGLIGFFGFYIYFFIRGLRLLKLPVATNDRILTITTLLNFVGLFIVALTNVCIVHYRFILIWAASIGLVEAIARKYE